jgi:hypothetical protein
LIRGLTFIPKVDRQDGFFDKEEKVVNIKQRGFPLGSSYLHNSEVYVLCPAGYHDDFCSAVKRNKLRHESYE